MTYSSALFPDRVEPAHSGGGAATVLVSGRWPPTFGDPAAAQRRKIDRLLDAAGVGRGPTCSRSAPGGRAGGPGGAARRSGPHDHLVGGATGAGARAGRGRRVTDRVDVELVDYREVTGTYDAVVSCEMIEAVGYEFMASYVGTIDARLRPGGRAAVQAITMPHDRMMASRHTHTWITKYIFPAASSPRRPSSSRSSASTPGWC